MEKVRILLSGARGRMGRAIANLVEMNSTAKIVAGVDLKTSDTSLAFPCYTDTNHVKEDFDVIIDFSHVSGVMDMINYAKQTQKPLIMCTTGLQSQHKQALEALSHTSAVFYSANMSLGVNMLVFLAKQAAVNLYSQFDIEIVEAHHNQKVDAPSGTALMIADAINQSLDNQLDYVYQRHDKLEKRHKNEIGIHAIRGGSIVGDHQIIFAGEQEVLTLSHQAQSRDVFAKGSLAAADFMKDKKAGMYDMNDLLSSRLSSDSKI